MGSRSRKRERRAAPRAPGGADAASGRAGAASSRTAGRDDRPAVRGPRPSRFEVRDGVARPEPVWAPFPLTEIAMAVGLVLFLVGFFGTGATVIGAGILVLAVATGELCLREHFAGFRPHSMLLALLAVVAVHALVYLVAGDAVLGPIALGVDLLVAAGLAYLLRDRFETAHARARVRGARG